MRRLKVSLYQLCREGINFALTRLEDHTPGAPPPYIHFLSVLGEFSNRLLEVDRTGKKGVLVYLQVCLIFTIAKSLHSGVHLDFDPRGAQIFKKRGGAKLYPCAYWKRLSTPQLVAWVEIGYLLVLFARN